MPKRKEISISFCIETIKEEKGKSPKIVLRKTERALNVDKKVQYIKTFQQIRAYFIIYLLSLQSR